MKTTLCQRSKTRGSLVDELSLHGRTHVLVLVQIEKTITSTGTVACVVNASLLVLQSCKPTECSTERLWRREFARAKSREQKPEGVDRLPTCGSVDAQWSPSVLGALRNGASAQWPPERSLSLCSHLAPSPAVQLMLLLLLKYDDLDPCPLKLVRHITAHHDPLPEARPLSSNSYCITPLYILPC